ANARTYRPDRRSFSEERPGGMDPRKEASQLRALEELLAKMLYSIFYEDKVLDRTLHSFFLDNKKFGSRDRKFLSECVFCCFRDWGYLRHLLSERELESMKFSAESRESGNFHQLLTAVRSLAGFRDFEFPRSAHDEAEKVEALFRYFHRPISFSTEDAVPPGIVENLAKEIDPKTLERHWMKRPPTWLRIQTGDVDSVIAALVAAGVPLVRHPRVFNAVSVAPSSVNLRTLPEYRDGLFEVQDIASQGIGLAARPKAGERWLDCCAGAGGKSLQLASIMHGRGTVIASDIRDYKLEELRKRAKRAHLQNIELREWDGKALRKRFADKYDGILVDAPCSCSGVWRRNPEGRWQFREEELDEFAAIGNGILDNVCSGVRPGGVLVYSTCSLFHKENADVVERFLASHAQFTLESFEDPVSGQQSDGMLQLGMEQGGDAMFVARMRRRMEESTLVDDNL
ncbi:MAG: RsmB/NOP family class I SAM-dependent RNA methyltransferase, partial [Victivallaceae bacterium]|nr:RsmB/NOP family class I SAM-dependent RNA methyltransferase [Victivallaceae bacterium]